MAIYFFVFFVGLIAGLVDTIAGGGGLLTLPALLSIGLPPHLSLGTNKLQSTFGSGSATLNFVLARKILFRDCLWGILWTFTGASIGTIIVQLIDSSFLGKIIPFLLVGIAFYTILTPKLGLEDVKPRMPERFFYIIFGLLIGFYDGFFGPGTGSFWAISFLLLLGYNFTKATAYTKVMNFTSNFASLLFFLIGGNVVFSYGIVMGIGQMIGARIGARIVLLRGAKVIKPLFVTVAILIAIKLIYQNFR